MLEGVREKGSDEQGRKTNESWGELGWDPGQNRPEIAAF